MAKISVRLSKYRLHSADRITARLHRSDEYDEPAILLTGDDVALVNISKSLRDCDQCGNDVAQYCLNCVRELRKQKRRYQQKLSKKRTRIKELEQRIEALKRKESPDA